jgi:hypothetical protein
MQGSSWPDSVRMLWVSHWMRLHIDNCSCRVHSFWHVLPQIWMVCRNERPDCQVAACSPCATYLSGRR